MMALTLSKNLSATMLVLTSFHSFNKLPPYFYYARAAFKLYMVCGCLLIFDDVGGYSEVNDAAQTVWLWSYCLGLPLLSAEICIIADFLPEFRNVHLILPTYTVMCYHFAPSYVDPFLLGLSHVFSLSCITLLSVATDNVACIALALVYYFAQFRYYGYGVAALDCH